MKISKIRETHLVEATLRHFSYCFTKRRPSRGLEHRAGVDLENGASIVFALRGTAALRTLTRPSSRSGTKWNITRRIATRVAATTRPRSRNNRPIKVGVSQLLRRPHRDRSISLARGDASSFGGFWRKKNNSAGQRSREQSRRNFGSGCKLDSTSFDLLAMQRASRKAFSVRDSARALRFWHRT